MMCDPRCIEYDKCNHRDRLGNCHFNVGVFDDDNKETNYLK